MRSLIVFVVGFGGGWAIRSLSDSPQGVGVNLLRLADDGRERLERWFAMERERLEDMLAEARSDAATRGAARSRTNGNGTASKKPVQRAQA